MYKAENKTFTATLKLNAIGKYLLFGRISIDEYEIR